MIGETLATGHDGIRTVFITPQNRLGGIAVIPVIAVRLARPELAVKGGSAGAGRPDVVKPGFLRILFGLKLAQAGKPVPGVFHARKKRFHGRVFSLSKAGTALQFGFLKDALGSLAG